MKKTGQMLKKERESQEISLNEISMATKVSVRMLSAVEEGNLNELPAKTYLRGYVKSYATQLKMDVDEVLEAFHDEMGSTLVQTDVSLAEEPIQQATSESQNEQTVANSSDSVSKPGETLSSINELLKKYGVISKLLYAGVLVALVLLIYGVRNVVIKYEKESQVEKPTDIKGIETTESEPAQEDPNVDEANEESQVSETKAESTSLTKESTKTEPEADEKLAMTAKSEPLEQTKEEPSPREAIETEQNPPPQDPVTERAEQVQNSPQDEAAVPEEKPAPTNPAEDPPVPSTASNAFVDKNEIIIEALDSVDIEFRIGKGDLQKINLGPDQVHTIKANAQVRIDFSDGGAVNITHNGRDRGVPGDLGKPKKVILP
jgi:cytoskeleton protein RodZ